MKHGDTDFLAKTVQRHAIAVHEALQSFGETVGTSFNKAQHELESRCRDAVSAAARHLRVALFPGSNYLGLSPMASLSGQVLQSVSANPMCDLAYNPEVIKKRLSGIPVYVVVNQKNEFVLVSSDNDTRQLGLFFFDIDDAQGLLDAVKKQDPHMGRLARVLQTSMDAVYDVAVMPREHSGTEDVTFRFMPAAAEVEAAIDLYHAANINQVSFEGVPLFQAEGLVVRGEEGNRYTPLFFSKHDLDVALSNAFLSRDSDAQASARAKLERAKSELDAAQKDVEAAEDAKAKRSAEKRRNGASSRVKKYEKDLADATAQRKAPRIDVGSLEQVIVEMEQDDKNQWGDVIFVRPGYASDVTASKKEMKGKK